ncbi:hypothetical protein KZ829_36545 [Actinoplanes hulinensis]|uniref:PKD domain-containing protein n=1 Tax=Actinoplanes hulinensis TaxID=1144547 RepID=A0ABS7BEF2_9ACTN|nr:hypothetical protein [Actinoplanes hulinensis]MBW6439247.1 hypothetical protein [Actinoplanes hulinensis]
MHRTVRALLSAAVAALSATTVLVGLPAAPAQAANYGQLPLSAWSYTDRAQPTTPNPNPAGDFLIGSSDEHTGRAYFTFDLAPLKGQVLHRVTFYTSERTVNDCSRVAPIEVWRTRQVTETTTWQHPPKELELLAERSYGKGVICPGAYLGIDMIPAIQAAFARGEKKLTIEVRINATAEGDTGVGRTMTQARMSYAANHAPRVSGLKLKYPDAGCGKPEKHPTAGNWMRVQATVTDADPNDHPQIVYAYWPVNRPDQRKESSSPSLDLSGLEDGTVVAWTAQGRDYDDAGPWGRTCYFTVDTVAPATSPVVSSKKYPSEDYPGTGGPGVPGTFVFDAAGDVDTVGFDWTLMDNSLLQSVTPNHPGGRAKITVTPGTWGPGRLQVAARDAAGNRGPWVQYRYQVRNTAPFAEIEMNGVGLTSHITLTSQAAEVTGFGYAVDGGPETRVPAVDRQGKGDLVFTGTGYRTVLSRAYAGNRMIGSNSVQLHVTDAPKVTSAEFDWPNDPVEGVAGSFTFTPRTTNVVSYLYGFGDGTQHSVDAGADGTAALTWTPQKSGYFTITVYSVDAAGNRSQAAQESFSVISARPTVSVNAIGAHVGDPISVMAWSNRPDAAGIVYSFDGGPQQTVDSSYANFDVVGTHSGDSVLKVWVKLTDGTLSPPTEEIIHLADSPKVTAQGPFGTDAVMGRPVSFTFTAAQEGATIFRYTVGGVQQTVPAGPDGTATVTYEVPDGWGDVTVAVASVTADGTVSDTSTFSMPLRNPNVEVFNPWPTDLPPGEAMGGVGIPGQFGFYAWDLSEVTTKFLWSVDDGPVQEVLYDPWAWETVASYTPERAGDHTLHVQREFTDGSRSPLVAVPFRVGNEVAPA